MGIIGCGNFMAAGHIGNLLSSPEVEIVGLADPSGESIARMKERFPALQAAPEYADHPSLLAEAGPDAVEIATPHALHAAHIIDSFEAGCHVLVEKPLVISTEEAKNALDKRDEAGKVLLVSYQRRYDPNFRYVRQIVSSGVLGELEFVSAVMSQGWMDLARDKWRQNPEISGGGMLLDTGSHLLDLLLFATGLDLHKVTAYSSNLSAPVEINSSVSLEFAGGCLGSVAVIGHAVSSIYEAVNIFGAEGSIRIEAGRVPGRSEVEISRQSYSDGLVELGELPDGSTPDANFIDAILGRDDVKSPGEAGLAVIRLTEAIQESVRLGREVTVAQSG